MKTPLVRPKIAKNGGRIAVTATNPGYTENPMPVSKKPAAPARRATLRAKPTVPAGWRHSGSADLYMMIYPHSALSDFILGGASQWHWNTLSFRLNLAKAIAEMYAPHESEAIGTLQSAINYLNISQTVHAETGVWKLTRMGQLMVGNGLHYADDLQKVCTRLQQRTAGIKLIRDCAADLQRLGMTADQAKRWLGTK